MDSTRPAELSRDEYQAVSDDLTQIWSRMDQVEVMPESAPAARLCFAAAAITHNQVHAARQLWAADLHCQPLANLREAYEAAVTAAWLQQNGQLAVDATFGTRQSNALVKTAHAAELVVPAGLEALLRDTADEMPELDPAEEKRARQFKQRCASLAGGEGLYLMYRALSRASHPTGHLADYLFQRDDGFVIPRKLPSPLATEHAKAIGPYTAAVSMLWATSACSAVQVTAPHDDELKQIAEHMNVPRTLATAQASPW